MTCFHEPTLADLLNDSITRAVMRADGVDPRKLETCLRDLAAQRTGSSEHAGCGRRSRLQMCGAL